MLKKILLISLISVFFNSVAIEEKYDPRAETITPQTNSLKKNKKNNKGSLTVICGSMCSGKSEELIRQIGRFTIAGLNVLVFKPSIDNREILKLDLNPLSYISSRSGSWTKCIAISNSQDILTHAAADEVNVVAIDEVMLFTQDTKAFIEIIQKLLALKKTIIIAGLDLNFRGEPFGAMPELLALADTVIKLTAICSICQEDTYCVTQRLINGEPAHYNDPLIVIGETQYEPRCRKCHIIKKD